MENIGNAAVLLGLAVLVETIIDMVKSRIVVPGHVAAYVWPASAMALGILMAFAAQVGISSMLPVSMITWVDRLLAGLIIGGGASTIYDLLDMRPN